MSNPAVKIVDVSKQFGSNFAAKNINMEIESGEFFCFLGPSGCGKTTLLRMIAGFETPTSGEILISGINMVNVPPHKRPVNMVFQNYALFPHLTVAENVAFGLNSSKKYRSDEIAKRVAEALDLVRLSNLSARYPAQLSGGQQQRIALARAAVNNPQVLLLDEPLSALDPQIREEMQVELASLQKRLNMTFVMVTHDQDEALALSNRIAVFSAGNLEQVGTPEEIYDKPRTSFVAKFIGRTNVFEGKVKEVSASTCLVDINGSLQLYVDAAHGVSKDERVIVWTKPHSIGLANCDQTCQPGENDVEAVVMNRSYQGTTTEYLLRLSGGIDARASCANASNAKEQSFNAGDTVRARIAHSALSILAS